MLIVHLANLVDTITSPQQQQQQHPRHKCNHHRRIISRKRGRRHLSRIQSNDLASHLIIILLCDRDSAALQPMEARMRQDEVELYYIS